MGLRSWLYQVAVLCTIFAAYYSVREIRYDFIHMKLSSVTLAERRLDSDSLHRELKSFLSKLETPKRKPSEIEKNSNERKATASILHSYDSIKKYSKENSKLFFASGSGMYSTDVRFRDSNNENSARDQSSGSQVGSTFSLDAQEGEPSVSQAQESEDISAKYNQPYGSDAAFENDNILPSDMATPRLATAYIDATQSALRTTGQGDSIAAPPSIESLEARMNRLAAELRTAQAQIRRYRLAPRASLKWTSSPKPPPADDAEKHARRPPLHSKPVWVAAPPPPRNSNPHRRHYWLNRPDPKWGYLEGRGVVVSAWPGVDGPGPPRRHRWGADGRDTYNATAHARPAFDYSRSRRPAWAADNHAMRSQPAYRDPDGPANVGLVDGRLPPVFADRWRAGPRHSAVGIPHTRPSPLVARSAPASTFTGMRVQETPPRPSRFEVRRADGP